MRPCDAFETPPDWNGVVVADHVVAGDHWLPPSQLFAAACVALALAAHSAYREWARHEARRRSDGDAPPTAGPSDLPADAADDDDLPLRIDTLPADLAPLVLERLTFSNLLALRLVCSRLNSMAYAVTKVTLNRRGHLYIPLLRKFSAVQSLTLEGFEQSWIPRLACVLGVFPRLVRLCLRKSRAAGGGGPVPQQMLTDGVMLGVVGALEAGACPLLNNLNLDERLPEATALQLAGAMPPNGGLLFATIQAHEAVVCAHAQNEAHFSPGRSSRLSQP